MNRRVVGLFSSPWISGQGSDPKGGWRQLLNLYRRGIRYKANPRTLDYMRQMFAQHFPSAEFVNVDEDPNWKQRLPETDQVVLLYPDALGQRFRSIENEVFKRRKAWASIYVLNGRRRLFLLNRATLWNVRLRRMIERWMVGEAIALFLFVLLTPFLLLQDLARGRT